MKRTSPPVAKEPRPTQSVSQEQEPMPLPTTPTIDPMDMVSVSLFSNGLDNPLGMKRKPS